MSAQLGHGSNAFAARDGSLLAVAHTERRWTVTIAYRCSVKAFDEAEALDKARAMFASDGVLHEWKTSALPGASAWVPGEAYHEDAGRQGDA